VAVSNIVANAVVHAHMRSRLRLKIEETIEEKGQNRHLTLSISDNGPGIPQEEQKSIFLLFKQGRLGVEYETGSGVGLTFAQFAMDLVGGSVALVPTSDGAMFQLRFPILGEN
jgi:signal transduction histidine kinase